MTRGKNDDTECMKVVQTQQTLFGHTRLDRVTDSAAANACFSYSLDSLSGSCRSLWCSPYHSYLGISAASQHASSTTVAMK